MRKFWSRFNKNCLAWLLVISAMQGVAAETTTAPSTTSTTTGTATSAASNGSPVYDETANYYLSIIADKVNQLFADIDAFYKWMVAAATQTLPSSAQMIATNTAPASTNENKSSSSSSSSSKSTSTTYLDTSAITASELTMTSVQDSFDGTRVTTTGDPSTLNFDKIIAPTFYQSESSDGSDSDQFTLATSFIQNLANAQEPISATGSSKSGTSKDSSSTNIFQSGGSKGSGSSSSSTQSDLGSLSGSSGSTTSSSSKDSGSSSNSRKPSSKSLQNVKNYYVAHQSIAFSNLYYLATERMILTGLGTKASLQTLPTVNADGTTTAGTAIADASILQVNEYMAKRRLFNPAWYAQVAASTSSLSIAKEILYLLAEIRYEQYQDRLLKERELAALTSLQLQTLQLSKTMAQAQTNMSNSMKQFDNF